MYSNNYKQLLIGSIILGSIIFFSNQLSCAQALLEKTDDRSDEILDVTIPSPSFLGEGLEDNHASIIAGDIIGEDEEEDNDQGNNDIPFELPFP
jgi:hypothetical protein